MRGLFMVVVWADKVSRPDYSSSHSFLKEFIWNLNTNILLPDVVYTVWYLPF